MNNAQFKRLKPFLKGVSHKSKLFLYLLAEGFSPTEITKLTLDSCVEATGLLSKPDEISISFETLYANHLVGKGEPVFVYPNGRKYSVADIEGVLTRAYETIGWKYAGVREFARYITKG